VSAAAVRPRSALGAFDELLGRPVSMRSLALLRVLVGPIVLLHLQPFLSASLDGRIYSDAFYEPYAAWYPEAPDRVTLRRGEAGWCCQLGIGRIWVMRHSSPMTRIISSSRSSSIDLTGNSTYPASSVVSRRS